jgi:hypothetical protein
MCLPRFIINLTPIFYDSSIRQPLTTQVTTTQRAKPLKIFTSAVVFRHGAEGNNNYRRLLSFFSILLFLIKNLNLVAWPM